MTLLLVLLSTLFSSTRDLITYIILHRKTDSVKLNLLSQYEYSEGINQRAENTFSTRLNSVFPDIKPEADASRYIFAAVFLTHNFLHG